MSSPAESKSRAAPKVAAAQVWGPSPRAGGGGQQGQVPAASPDLGFVLDRTHTLFLCAAIIVVMTMTSSDSWKRRVCRPCRRCLLSSSQGPRGSSVLTQELACVLRFRHQTRVSGEDMASFEFVVKLHCENALTFIYPCVYNLHVGKNQV